MNELEIITKIDNEIDIYKENLRLINKIIELENQRIRLLATLEQIYVNERHSLTEDIRHEIEKTLKECGGLIL